MSTTTVAAAAVQAVVDATRRVTDAASTVDARTQELATAKAARDEAERELGAARERLADLIVQTAQGAA